MSKSSFNDVFLIEINGKVYENEENSFAHCNPQRKNSTAQKGMYLLEDTYFCIKLNIFFRIP